MATSTTTWGNTAYLKNPLVGHRDSLQQLERLLETALSGQKQIVRIEGISGIGKSHLVAEFARRARAREVVTAVETCQVAHQGTPYYPWQAIFRSLLGLSEPASGSTISSRQRIARDISRLEVGLEGMNPDWLIRLPLLGDLLGFPIPDNSTTVTFKPRLRQEALFGLVEKLLQRWARQSSGLVVVLEDVQWLDEASWALLASLSRSETKLPVLFILTHQPHLYDRFPGSQRKDTLLSHLQIKPLGDTAMAELISHHLPGPLPPAILDWLVSRVRGHPLFAGELIKLLQASGHLSQDRAGAWQLATAPVALPDAVEGLILARFNYLPAPDQVTLQAAAAIGRFFEVDLLARIHPARPGRPELLTQLDNLEQQGFIQPSTARTYLFSHGLTHQVISQSLPAAEAGRLHQAITLQLEQYQPEAVERLAFHGSRSEVEEKMLLYLQQAARRARREYANETALNYYRQLLALGEDWRWRKEVVELLHILGRRETEKRNLGQLSANLQTPTYYVGYLWGRYFAATGNYPKALDSLALALADSRDKNDLPGQMRCLAELGKVDRLRGEYQQAAKWYRQALGLEAELKLSEPAGAQVFSEVLTGLSMVCMHQGAFAEAHTLGERALVLSHQTGNLAGEANAHNVLGVNLAYQGQVSGALWHEQQTLRLRRLIGDRRGVGSSLCNLAQSYSSRGDYAQARKLLSEALNISQTVGDRWAEVNVWNELGIVYQELGALDRAEGCLWRGMALVREIGDEGGQGYLLSNLGLVALERTALRAAGVLLQRGLSLAQGQDDPYLTTFLCQYLSRVNLKRGRLYQAIIQAATSLEIRQTLGIEAMTADNLSLLAAAYLALGELRQALTFAEQALAVLAASEGAEFPQLDYLLCYQVLAAAGHLDRAVATVQAGYELVQDLEGKIHDPQLRRSFLGKAENQILLEAYHKCMWG